MADIRTAVHTWYQEDVKATLPSVNKQKELALELHRETYAEDKLAGALFLQEILLPAGAIRWRKDLPQFARLFRDGSIADWNTCDWFCVKVLGPLAQQGGEPCARAIAKWCTAKNLWQRRAAGVAFVNLAKHGNENFSGFTAMLLEVCAAPVKHPERFAQTGTGWVLRELGQAEAERVVRFIEDNISSFSAEGLRYALEKMPPQTKAQLTRLHRGV
jgi:3-methyladenine DNA glycosylase AlkD